MRKYLPHIAIIVLTVAAIRLFVMVGEYRQEAIAANEANRHNYAIAKNLQSDKVSLEKIIKKTPIKKVYPIIRYPLEKPNPIIRI